jgi:hypothetical protein
MGLQTKIAACSSVPLRILGYIFLRWVSREICDLTTFAITDSLCDTGSRSRRPAAPEGFD